MLLIDRLRAGRVVKAAVRDQWWEHSASSKMIGIGTPRIQSNIPRPM